MCNIDPKKGFHKKHTKCKDCTIKKALERYYEKKVNLSNQRKI